MYRLTVILRYEEVKNVPDPALDDLGKKQCAQLAVNLDRAIRKAGLPPPEVIVTSPLARALETTQLGVVPVVPLLRPIVLESLREGLTGTQKNERHGKDWIAQRFPSFNVENVDEFDQLGARYNSPERQEPYDALKQRVQGALAYVFEHFADASVVLLMSHCSVLQTIQRDITGWDVPEEQRKDAVEFFVGEAGGYAIVVKGVRSYLES